MIPHRLPQCVVFVAIVCLFNVTGEATPARGTTVALLRDSGAAKLTLADDLNRAWSRAGLVVTSVSWNQLANPHEFDAEKFDCLVLPQGSAFSPKATRNVLAFFNGGGDLVLLGEQVLWADDLMAVARELPEEPSVARPLGFCERFDDYDVYRMNHVVRVAACREQDWFEVDLDLPMAVSGRSAVGFPFPGESKYVPLLVACDQHDRQKGFAGGMMIHFAGPYKHSHWALFGVHEDEFYRRPAVTALLARLIERFGQPEWLERAARESALSRSRKLELTTPPPARLSIRDGHFVYPDGRRFFLVGVNLFNSFDGFYGGGPQWDVNALERDFRRMRDAGINAVRIHGFARFAHREEPERLAAFLELARKYRVYILPSLIGHTYYFQEKKAMQDEARRVAGLLKNEPMVLGYDLQNEPYWHELAKIRVGDKTLGQLYPDGGGWAEYQRRLKVSPADWTTTFPGLSGPLPRPTEPALQKAFDSVNGIFATWIKWHLEAVRSVDQEHPITVGYNTIYDCLPANEVLDFVSHHVYEKPTSYENVMANITTMDRLKKIWPDRPITLGEFAYSSGDLIDGKYLDVDSQAVGEMIHYLYALAEGYDGVMRWQLCDWAPPNQWRQGTWTRTLSEPEQVRQSRFGMYFADGTVDGRPKPLAYATRFLQEYLQTANLGGAIEVCRAKTAIGAGYVYRSDRGLFIGNVAYDSPQLSFSAAYPVNVMLTWDRRQLKIMATRDTTVTLDPAAFVQTLEPSRTHVTGKRGQLTPAEKGLQIEMLSGETIVIRQAPRDATDGLVHPRNGVPK